jgi:8-oxo-dGTP diphosphatase
VAESDTKARRETSMPCDVLPCMAPVCRRGVVAVVMRADRFLVVRRSATVVAPGMFCFPGGGIESRETEEQAVIREFQEELQASLHPCRRVWRCQTAWQVDLAWWVGELDAGAVPLANPAEVESLHWLTGTELRQLNNLLDCNHEFLRQVAAGRIMLGP